MLNGLLAILYDDSQRSLLRINHVCRSYHIVDGEGFRQLPRIERNVQGGECPNKPMLELFMLKLDIVAVGLANFGHTRITRLRESRSDIRHVWQRREKRRVRKQIHLFRRRCWLLWHLRRMLLIVEHKSVREVERDVYVFRWTRPGVHHNQVEFYGSERERFEFLVCSQISLVCSIVGGHLNVVVLVKRAPKGFNSFHSLPYRFSDLKNRIVGDRGGVQFLLWPELNRLNLFFSGCAPRLFFWFLV